MKKHHRSLAQRTIDSLKQLWNRRQARDVWNRDERGEDTRGRKKSFLFEPLENRSLMAADLGWLLPDTNVSDNNTPAVTSTQAPASAGEASVVANDLVAFAKALTTAGVKFYGAAWCPHCTATKELFEDGGKYLPFIEVTNPDKTPNAIATANNITSYPTWVFQNGSRLTGQRTLAEISAAAGIAIPQTSTPFLGELPDVTLQGGSPLMVGLDGYDPNGGTLTYTVTSDNPSLVQPTLLTGNESLRINVNGYGSMVYQLFDNFAPRVTNRIKQLVEGGFYNQTGSNNITFHRVIDNFVLQAGDPTGTGAGGSTLGDFDDQFHVDLQHNRSGLLSMAKSDDDTNDSQFFITEERNQSWHVTLTGTPTGGSYTLSYNGQTTAPIAFDNAGNFNTNAANIQSALQALTNIGSGNVTVTHDPARNSSNVVTENRRFKIEFTGTLGGQTLMPITGNGSALTGGTTAGVSLVEGPKSARHLDFNHSIFGALVEGDSNREAISEVPVGANDKPNANVTIGSMEIFNDVENGMLMLKAAEGATGSANITVTVTDADGQTMQRMFKVDVRADTKNGAPFLAEIAPISIVTGGSANFNIQATDVEGNPIYYDAVKPTDSPVNYTLNVNHDTGAVSITPPANFTGTFDVILGVRGLTGTDTGDTFDSQIVMVNVGPAGTVTVDLAEASDTGSSNSDNITNAGTLNFVVSGVTNGATVTLYNGNTPIGQGNATGNTITIPTVALGTLGSGTYQITASQTVSNAEGPRSAAIPVVFDNTAPGAFTSTASSEATVNTTYTHNAQSPDEGTAGYVYSLSSAPGGVAIHATTGVLSWTPTAGQVGQHTFAILGTDAAGNSVNQPITVNVVAAAPKDIEVILKIVDANGDELNNLNVGQEFFLAAFVSDTRVESDGPPFGVFTFFTDVTYTSNVMVNGAIQHSNTYASQTGGSTATAGLIDEVGGTASLTALGRGEFQLFRVPMKATAGGTVTFTADQNETVGLEAGVYGENDPIPVADILYGTTSATVGLDFAAVNDTVNFNEDSTTNTINPLTNDTVTGGSNSELVITTTGATSNGGTVTVSTDGKSLNYVPAANFAGLDTFTYTIRRGAAGGPTTTGTINVQVQPTNDAPNAVNDTKTVTEDSTDNSVDVLGNDLIAPDTNETLVVSAVTQGSSGGTVSIGPGGNSVRYTPAANFVGTETFTYTARDTGGLTDTATVTVTVTDANDNPVTAADTATTTEDVTTPITINVLANDTTEAGETLTLASVGTTSSGGTVAIVSGQVTYRPAANFQGTETFTYTVNDGNNGTATGTVTVTVSNVNDAPTATADAVNAFKNTLTTLNVLSNDSSNPDPTETLVVSAVTQGTAGGTISIGANGANVQYTPANNFTGTDTFTYTVRDPGGLTHTATVTVTVQNFAPSSLAGSVFKNGSTGPLAGVTVTLTGTDVNNAAVSRTATTDVHGNYKFDALIPGTYKLKQTQPQFMTDGVDIVGSQGGTLSANDEISVTLAQGTDGTGNNFGEAGIVPMVTTGTGSTATTTFTMRKSDLFSHNSKHFVLAAVDTSTGQVWYSDVGSTFIDTSTQTSFALNSTGANASDPKLTIQTRNSAGVQQTATVPVSSPHVRTVASSGNMRLYRIRGNSSFYDFTPVGTTTATDSSSTSGGEFIDPQHAQATDALMALLGSQDEDGSDDE